jgi:hypothetical protein
MVYQSHRVRAFVFVVLTAAASMHAVHAQSVVPEAATAAVSPSRPAAQEPEDAPTSGGNVATLSALNAQGKLTELRSSSATDYGAKLFFYGEGLTYYVALLQQNNYWLVVDTSDTKRAQAIYGEFVQRTLRLSQANQQRAELEARTASIQRIVAQTQAHQAQLQADLDIDRAQSERSAALQNETAQQVATLRQEETRAQVKLAGVQREVLREQCENTRLLASNTAGSAKRRGRHVNAVRDRAKPSHPKKT